MGNAKDAHLIGAGRRTQEQRPSPQNVVTHALIRPLHDGAPHEHLFLLE
jgi:hypothetical protein